MLTNITNAKHDGDKQNTNEDTMAMKRRASDSGANNMHSILRAI